MQLAALAKRPILSTDPRQTDQLPDLYGFIPKLGRNLTAPRHLDPLVRSLEAAWTRPVYQTAHAPPRHAKTDTVLAWAALTLRRQPWRTIAYISYESHIARSKSRKARNWYLAAGGKLADSAGGLAEWRTLEGGGFISGGIGGPLTSHGVDILIIDDPYKHRQQAESSAYRQMTTDWWGDVGETRIEPGGSAFIFHTRWNPDDLIAHVLDGEGGEDWEPHIRLPAISDAGLALWPERWPVEELDRKRRSVGALTWASLFQGLPRPRGGAVFNGTSIHEGLDRWSNIAIGIDLAYSSRKSADYSVAVVVAEAGGLFYVLDVLRLQVSAPSFRAHLKALHSKYKEPRIASYIGGTERGVIDFLEEGDDGIPIEASAARSDKLVRAQPVAAAWNDGKILVPKFGASISEFTAEVLGFTGVKDTHDDCVDALAAAFDALSVGEADYDDSYDDALPAFRSG